MRYPWPKPPARLPMMEKMAHDARRAGRTAAATTFDDRAREYRRNAAT